MGILSWDKPKKKLSKADWKESYGFEDGPTGGFVPNMDEADEKKWKAKLTGQKLGFPQVEIRKTASCQMTIIVNLGAGYNYKYYRAIDPDYFGKTPADFPSSYRNLMTQQEIDDAATPTKGINVHVAMNGPAQMSFQDILDMQEAILEAKAYLEDYVANNPPKP